MKHFSQTIDYLHSSINEEQLTHQLLNFVYKDDDDEIIN